jgi:hypothetical protein
VLIAVKRKSSAELDKVNSTNSHIHTRRIATARQDGDAFPIDHEIVLLLLLSVGLAALA